MSIKNKSKVERLPNGSFDIDTKYILDLDMLSRLPKPEQDLVLAKVEELKDTLRTVAYKQGVVEEIRGIFKLYVDGE